MHYEYLCFALLCMHIFFITKLLCSGVYRSTPFSFRWDSPYFHGNERVKLQYKVINVTWDDDMMMIG